jgi:hypothetical protein
VREFAASTNVVPVRSDSSSGSGTAYSSEELIQSEKQYSAHNYHPIPVVFARANGSYVWDPEGRKYLDFLSAYSAVNQVPLPPLPCRFWSFLLNLRNYYAQVWIGFVLQF